LWDSKLGSDMVEEKTRYCVNDVVKCGHGFGPFGKIIHYHHNVLMSITGWRIASHEYIPNLQKGLAVMSGCRRASGARALLP
jgi:hypothetical protein